MYFGRISQLNEFNFERKTRKINFTCAKKSRKINNQKFCDILTYIAAKMRKTKKYLWMRMPNWKLLYFYLSFLHKDKMRKIVNIPNSSMFPTFCLLPAWLHTRWTKFHSSQKNVFYGMKNWKDEMKKRKYHELSTISSYVNTYIHKCRDISNAINKMNLLPCYVF